MIVIGELVDGVGCSTQRATPLWAKQFSWEGVILPYNEKCIGSLPYKVSQVPIGLQTTLEGNVGFGVVDSLSSTQRARPFLLKQED